MRTCILLAALLCCGGLSAATVVLDPINHISDWKFDNGQEFPGATGDLAKNRKAPALMLSYDFSKGGTYVQAIRAKDFPAGATRFRYQAQADADSRITVRILTADKRCFQTKGNDLVGGKNASFIVDLTAPFNEAWGGVGESKIPDSDITGVAILVSGRNGNTVGTVGIHSLTVEVK